MKGKTSSRSSFSSLGIVPLMLRLCSLSVSSSNSSYSYTDAVAPSELPKVIIGIMSLNL